MLRSCHFGLDMPIITRFFREKGHQSMILGSLTHHASAIEVGGVYRKPGGGPLIEIAHVVEITADRLGIKHVRFELHSSRGAGVPLIETRTLGLEVFQSRFRERVREQN